MNRPRSVIMAVVLALVAAVALLASMTAAAPQGAATNLAFASQACQADGTVAGRLTWTPSGLGDQYVDLSADSSFASVGTGGPFAGSTLEVDLTALVPGRTYYTRVWTLAGSQWLLSDTLAISTTTCGPSAPPPPAAGGTLTLTSRHSNLCLEIFQGSQNNTASATQSACSGAANQSLQAVPLPDGYFELRFAHSGKCLEVLGWDWSNGAALGQYACHGGDNQRWTGTLSNGAITGLRNKFSQKCVDVYAWSRSEGAPIAQWDCHGGKNQQWRVRVSRSSAPPPASGPVIAITIDTDTIRGYMPQMLDILDSYGVKASFGVTGPWAVNNPDLVQRMVASGHTVMNHSWTHSSFPAISSEARFNELRWTDDAIMGIAGVSTRPYFRPPYGNTNAGVQADAAAAGYRIVLWSIDPQGWRGYSGDAIMNHILTHAHDGGVVLMHSTNAGDVNALGPTIAALKARGYQFVTIAQLYP